MSAFKVSVIGGGSFGTVIANITAENGHDVGFWMRSESQAQELNRLHENSQYLPDYRLNERIHATSDMAEAVKGSRLIFVAVPSSSFRQVVSDMVPYIPEDAILVSTTKGIEAGSFAMMSQILNQEAPRAKVGVLSGPNLALEIAKKDLAGTVIASPHEDVRDIVKSALKSKYFRVYANNDMFGVELGGSLKNIYAIIAGIAAALGMGHNTNSMLVTRALTEMARFGKELGADPMTFLGLAGVGDLVVTCSTPLSRNYRVGLALGKGTSVEKAVAELGQVAEGVNTVKLVRDKAQELGVYMPLANGLYKIIYEKDSMDNIISSLMLSEQALDVEFAANEDKVLD
ncbi:MAG: NAD(P)H-dependent glycerol-3-phosphate dehydrogenase [Gammaproteobacteria bacterium]|mgnify:FL=1|nr:NAD(P)H-dependent glycerol-3-phosphate dehydrogenase [Gammaproteobacteria bacterium]MBT7227748.1 NAD(P)H-dependent glycerol-3-phosphate dehydrogenase [Gammaproteobacteria bacterium]MDC3267522.1 NAD(P)H-dependent glycerol-3-phosphate dehydrogenase [bacterium]